MAKSTEVLEQSRVLLTDLNKRLEELTQHQMALVENYDTLLENQNRVVENHAIVTENQKTIIRNQGIITHNQGSIIHNQAIIASNQAYLKTILELQTEIMSHLTETSIEEVANKVSSRLEVIQSEMTKKLSSASGGA